MTNLTVMRRGVFLASLPVFFINFSIPVQAKQLGASALDIGLLFSVFTFSLLVLRPVVGLGLDRIGRKAFLVLATLLYALCHIAYAMADSLTFMYTARLIQGGAAALLLITMDTMTADMTDPKVRPTEMGRNIETQTRGSIAGATVGFTFVGFQSALVWELSFGFYAITAMAAFVYLFFRLEESGHKPVEPAPFELSPGLKRLLVIVFFAGFASALMQPIYLIYLQDSFDVPLRFLTWAFLPAAIVFAVLPSRAGRLSQRFGTLNLLVLGLLLSAVTYLALPFISDIYFFVILYTVSAFGWAMSDPARKALTASLGQENATGRSFGVTELYGGIGATLGPAIGGYLYDSQGATATFAGTGILLSITALVAWALLRNQAA